MLTKSSSSLLCSGSDGLLVKVVGGIRYPLPPNYTVGPPDQSFELSSDSLYLRVLLLFSSLSPQVNGVNVVKVGHRQVVNMIRQGGNSLMMKVVMVTRNPEMDEVPKKKGQESGNG